MASLRSMLNRKKQKKKHPLKKTEEGDKEMKIRRMKGNDKGQVLGLPMYLIIIMIIAVVVIAAVIFMLPQGSKMIDAQVVENSMISISGDGQISGSPVGGIVINVFTKDERADPISGATVTLTGAGVAYQAVTDDDGTITVPAASVTAILEANKNIDHVTMTIKASGFEDYKDDQAITVVRTQTV